MTITPTRRERLRTATVVEIKALARRLLVAGGPQSISLRAIARDMGMTAPAIYRYFPSLDALIAELTRDLYTELRESIETALTTVAPPDPLRQLVEMARALRRWSIGHPAEFALMFGNPVPGVPVPGVTAFSDRCTRANDGGANDAGANEAGANEAGANEAGANEAGAKLGAPFLRAMAEVWARAPFSTSPVEDLEAKLGPHLRPCAGLQQGTDLPIEIVYTYISAWTRLYGLIAMEVFGHLQWAMTTVEPLFEIELAGFVARMRPAADPKASTMDVRPAPPDSPQGPS